MAGWQQFNRSELADAFGDLGTLIPFVVKVERNQLRFFTHTVDPVARPDGGPGGYGCTEFVFPVAAGRSTSEVFGTIDRVLTVQAG